MRRRFRGSAASRRLSALRVLLVGDVLEPGDDLPLSIGFLHGDVSHEAVGSRAVPVHFVRLDVNDVTRPDLLDLTIARSACCSCPDGSAACSPTSSASESPPKTIRQPLSPPTHAKTTRVAAKHALCRCLSCAVPAT